MATVSIKDTGFTTFCAEENKILVKVTQWLNLAWTEVFTKTNTIPAIRNWVNSEILIQAHKRDSLNITSIISTK
jgi:hypothetical protein